MDIAKTVWDTGCTCWERGSKYLTYIRSLGDNLAALQRKKDELSGVSEDVIRRVEKAEGEQWIRTSEVDGWLQKVQLLTQEADLILQKGEQEMKNSCFCGLCPKNCLSRYKQSKLAEAKKVELDGALVQGRGIQVVAYEPADLILTRCIEALRSKMSELESVFEDVKRLVKEAEDRNLTRTAEVGSWLERVGHLMEEVGKILEKGGQEMEKSRLQLADHSPDNSQLWYELSKLSEEKKATLDEELCKGRIFAAAGTISSVANALLNPVLKGLIDVVLGQKEGGQSPLKLPDWSAISSPGGGSSQPQESSGREALTTEGTR
ncbi:hypothetical protein CRG98_015352 [Punica granatum]|uniref:Uncharacterized protein n=1 Tax=Punica granatum TaxID=22663 RepID=A0A2I0K6S8_PUNGR|nr:hypothetical protein CRG98_015352 [Punica granatum]